MPVCNKDNGQCQCRNGIKGRQCNEVEDEFYVPTMHQFQHEIEDGYRADQATVRIGHDDARFPGIFLNNTDSISDTFKRSCFIVL